MPIPLATPHMSSAFAPAQASPSMVANPWFATLTALDQQALLANAERLRLQPAEMLFRQSAVLGGFYGLLRGTLKISSLREAILALLESGNWIGEISLIDGDPRTHDATALNAAEVLVVVQPAFAALMSRASFALAIARLLTGRVRSLYSMVEDTTLRSTRTRVARRLLLLARGDATLAVDARPSVPVSQEALAMMLGITRQTLSKELKALQALGAVSMRYKRIEIVSAAQLDAL